MCSCNMEIDGRLGPCWYCNWGDYMKVKEFLTSKRTWTLIGSLIMNLFQFASSHGLIK